MNEYTLTVSLDYLHSMDKGELHNLLVAAMGTGSIDAQEAMVIGMECGVELIPGFAVV
jgi:hypothetical protein